MPSKKKGVGPQSIATMMTPERFCKCISSAWRVVNELAAAGSADAGQSF
jgi:hypothetical protein